MHWRVRGDVTWPTAEQWVTVQNESLTSLEDIAAQAAAEGTPLESVGTLTDLDPGAPPVRLVRGAWFRPGSSYALALPPDSDAMTVDAEYSRSRAMDVTVRLRTEGRRRATLTTASLDSPLRLRSSSSWRYLRWEATVDLASRRVVDATATLRWCRARLQVTRQSTEATAPAVLDITVTGRGIWRPVVASARLLTLFVGTGRGPGLDEQWQDLCNQVTVLATDPSLEALEAYRMRQAERGPRLADEGFRMIEARLTQVNATVNARLPGFRSHRRWRKVWNDLPAADWPKRPHGMVTTWAEEEAAIVNHISWRLPGDRAEALADSVAFQRTALLGQVAARKAMDEGITNQAGSPSDGTTDWRALTEADFDLSFLASPFTLIARAKHASPAEDPTSPGPSRAG